MLRVWRLKVKIEKRENELKVKIYEFEEFGWKLKFNFSMYR